MENEMKIYVFADSCPDRWGQRFITNLRIIGRLLIAISCEK